jgi:hypothetical protein
MVSADPSVLPPPEATAQPESPPEGPALAIPHVQTRRPKASSAAQKPKLDTVEPWDGEDLAAEVELAALERPRLDVDRVDPWTPSVTYPANPGFGPELEDEDPWAGAKSEAPRRVAKMTKKKRKLESSDPWLLPQPSEHAAKKAHTDEGALPP